MKQLAAALLLLLPNALGACVISTIDLPELNAPVVVSPLVFGGSSASFPITPPNITIDFTAPPLQILSTGVLTTSIVTQWTQPNPIQASDWISSINLSPLREFSSSEIEAQRALLEPQIASNWLENIGTEEERTRILQQLSPPNADYFAERFDLDSSGLLLTAVPEPTTFTFSLIGLFGLLRRRR